MTHAEAMLQAIMALRTVGLASADQDAHRLFAAVFGARAAQCRSSADHCAPTDLSRFQHMIAARADRQPVSQIIGRRAFWNHDFIVTRDTLDPRPETELLVEYGIAHSPKTVLDLGTGTGAIILSVLAALPQAVGTATDISKKALAVARCNAAALGLTNRVDFVLSDWFDAVTERFDLIVCNPPYIAADELSALEPDVAQWEPLEALSPGPDGLAAYRTIFPLLSQYLTEGGVALFEHGHTQSDAVAKLAVGVGLTVRGTLMDLSGKHRAIALTSAP